jgi:hypothetical protein
MAKYYVSTYVDEGRDSNPGTIDSPWLSAAHAFALADSIGDIIHFNSGIFPVDSRLDLAEGVSIEGEGEFSILESSITGEHTLLLSSNAINIDGNQSVSYLKFDGDSETAYGAIQVYHRGNVEIHHCTIVDFSDWGVSFRGRYNDSSEPSAGEWAVGNSIHDCTIDNCSAYIWAGSDGDTDKRGGNGQGLIEITEQEGMLIYNNTLTQNSRPTWHNGYCIKGIYGFNRDIKIYNNTLTKNLYNGETWDFAIELWDCRGGIEIYDNIINAGIDFSGNGSGGTGISSQSGSYDYSLYIHDNIIGPDTYSGTIRQTKGIYVEQSAEDVIIERNWIKNVDIAVYHPGLLMKSDESGQFLTNITIQSNVFNNIYYTGNYIGFETVNNYVIDGYYVFNNTIIANTGASTEWGIQIPGGDATVSNVSIRNNIVQGFNIPVYGDVAVSGTYSIENNCFYNNISDTPSHAGSPTEQNNITSNPVFVSPSYFHLQDVSPAIGVGIHLDPHILDYDGNAFANPPSIGAYPFTTTGSVPNTNTFSLQDVCDVILPSENTLTHCYAEADPNKFDPEFHFDDTYLSEFRNYGGSSFSHFSDYYLPSKDELNAVYLQLKVYNVGNLNAAGYASSSEYSATQFWKQMFTDGSQTYEQKGNGMTVRPIRSFAGVSGAYAMRSTGPAGGLIFDYTAGIYYEAAISDINIVDVIGWSNVTNSAIGTTGTAIGTGAANTAAIIAQANHTASAAKLCSDLVV